LAVKQAARIYFPSPSLCGDNAAMLGVPANYYLEHGQHADNKLNAISSWPLDMVGVI
jgi:N6-L-threonylcarbamoyladenine synthase